MRHASIRTRPPRRGDEPAPLPRDVEATVDAILDRIEAALIQGGRVELRNFGGFSTRHRGPAGKRNPCTGAAVAVGERIAVHFKPAKAVRERLNLEEAGPAVEVARSLRAS